MMESFLIKLAVALIEKIGAWLVKKKITKRERERIFAAVNRLSNSNSESSFDSAVDDLP